MARGHDNDEWNLSDLQQAIKKEVKVFEAELMTSHPPHGSHPTAAFHTRQPLKLQDDLVYHLNALVLSARDPTPPQISRQLQTTKHVRSLSLQRVCFNCLGKHKVSAYTSRYCCHKCYRKHHTSLCGETSPKRQETQRVTLSPQKLSNLLLRRLSAQLSQQQLQHRFIWRAIPLVC